MVVIDIYEDLLTVNSQLRPLCLSKIERKGIYFYREFITLAIVYVAAYDHILNAQLPTIHAELEEQVLDYLNLYVTYGEDDKISSISNKIMGKLYTVNDIEELAFNVTNDILNSIVSTSVITENSYYDLAIKIKRLVNEYTNQSTDKSTELTVDLSGSVLLIS